MEHEARENVSIDDFFSLSQNADCILLFDPPPPIMKT